MIIPSPKFPTSKSPPKTPKVLGAIATPHGAFKLPPLTAVATKFPLRSKTSRMPSPAPTVCLKSVTPFVVVVERSAYATKTWLPTT